MAQDKAFGYLGYPISSPLMHLTSGELIRIVLSDSYWSLFSNHFPAQKGIVQTKLEEIGNVRNAVAHFRPLKRDDVEVVKQNANQVLSGVEDLLVHIVSCPDTVPTNSTDAWYSELRMLSGPYAELEFRQSVNEQWVRIGVKYTCPLLSEPYISDTYRTYRMLSVNTPRVLLESSAILENIIFASEVVPYVAMPKSGPPLFSKTLRLLFSRRTLAERHEDLKAELEQLLKRITTETDLIREDNLARVVLVQSVGATARREAQESDWRVATSNLLSPAREDDPPEFWAGHPLFGMDFVSHTESFPWMPVTVAEFDVPF